MGDSTSKRPNAVENSGNSGWKIVDKERKCPSCCSGVRRQVSRQREKSFTGNFKYYPVCAGCMKLTYPCQFCGKRSVRWKSIGEFGGFYKKCSHCKKSVDADGIPAAPSTHSIRSG